LNKQDIIPSELISHMKEFESSLYQDRLLVDGWFERISNYTINLLRQQQHRKNEEEKVITGVTGPACVGKSSLLEILEGHGWRVLSRGDLGTYAGKTSCAATVAALHSALDFALSLSDVIGDRGPIDNPLWQLIEHLLNPKWHEPNNQLSNIAFEFFRKTFTLTSMQYFLKQKFVIILDLSIAGNRDRQLKRNENGDAHRARLPYYALSQIYCYYLVARLFEWPIICVPYVKETWVNEIPETDWLQYEQVLCPWLLSYFGEPEPQPYNPICEKLDGPFPLDLIYAEAHSVKK
jgi:hypothetical protein